MAEGAREAGNRSSSGFISGSWERKREMMNCHLSPGWTAGEGEMGREEPGLFFCPEFIITGREGLIGHSVIKQVFECVPHTRTFPQRRKMEAIKCFMSFSNYIIFLAHNIWPPE